MIYIENAQIILTRIEEKCKNILDLESKLDMIDFSELKLSSVDILEYENLISDFLENLMHVDVNQVINAGFLCNFSNCETTFFLGKKRVLALMTHILQDITLFRNKLNLAKYVQLFSHIVKRQLSINLIGKINQDIKQIKPRINQLKGLIIQNSESEKQLSYKNELLLLENKDKISKSELEIWEKEKRESGIEANEIDVEIRQQTDEETISIIMGKVPFDRISRVELIILLRKIIYLRNLDNLCNTMLNRENEMDETKIQQGIDIHNKWINVLETVSKNINDLINVK